MRVSGFLHLISQVKWILVIPAFYFVIRGGLSGPDMDTVGVGLIYAGFMGAAHSISDRDRDPVVDIPDGLAKFFIFLLVIVALALLGFSALAALDEGLRDSLTLGLISLALGMLAGARAEWDANRF